MSYFKESNVNLAESLSHNLVTERSAIIARAEYSLKICCGCVVFGV